MIDTSFSLGFLALCHKVTEEGEERVRVRGKHPRGPLASLTPALSRSGEREKDEPSVVLDWAVTEKLV